MVARLRLLDMSGVRGLYDEDICDLSEALGRRVNLDGAEAED